MQGGEVGQEEAPGHLGREVDGDELLEAVVARPHEHRRGPDAAWLVAGGCDEGGRVDDDSAVVRRGDVGLELRRIEGARLRSMSTCPPKRR